MRLRDVLRAELSRAVESLRPEPSEIRGLQAEIMTVQRQIHARPRTNR